MTNFSRKQATILWADDDPDEIELMRAVLNESSNNYHIVEAANGKEVLRYLEQAKLTGDFPCLIVLDLNMPILNGKETLALLKQESLFKDIPTVVFTTSGSAADHNYCRNFDTEMITKPVTFAALKEVIEKLLNMCEVPVKAE